MKERKKPGPHPEKPLEHDLKVRVHNETLAKIEFCMKELSMTRSQVLRRGVDVLYDELQKNKKGSGRTYQAIPLPSHQQLPKGNRGVNTIPHAAIPFKALLENKMKGK